MQVTWTAILLGVSWYHHTTRSGAGEDVVRGRAGRAYKGRKGEAERRGDPCPADSTITEECSGWFCGPPTLNASYLGCLGALLSAWRRTFREAFDRRPDEAISTLSYLSVPAATGSKPRVSVAFSKEAIHTSSEKLGCYLPKHEEFSGPVRGAPPRLRLNQHKQLPARAAPPKPVSMGHLCILALPARAGFSENIHTAENTVPTEARSGHRTTTHLTCRSSES